MVYKCMYCGKKADSIGNVTLHKFPSDEETFMRWLEKMGLPNLKFSKCMRLCSNHFDESCLKKNKSYTTIKSGAVPTIFHKEYKNSCIYCKAKKGESDKLFHKFPFHDNSLMAEWLKNIDMKDFYPTSQSLLCSSHFEDSCYRRDIGRKAIRIKLKAVPTIFSKKPPLSFTVGTQTQEMDEKELYLLESNDRKETIEIIDTSANFDAALDADTNETVDPLMIDNPIYHCEAMIEEPSAAAALKTVRKIIANDHKYMSSPKCMSQNLERVRKKLAQERYESKKKNKKILRLLNKITSLQKIVQELRQQQSTPENGLVSFQSTADPEVIIC